MNDKIENVKKENNNLKNQDKKKVNKELPKAQKEKYKNYAEIQNDFYNQIKAVKLKKVTPNANKSVDSRKDPSSKGGVQVVQVSVDKVKDLIVQRLKNTHIMDVKTGKEIKDKSFVKARMINKKNIENNEKEKEKGKEKEKEKTKKYDLKALRKEMEDKNISNKNGPINNNTGRKNPRRSVNYNNPNIFLSKAIGFDYKNKNKNKNNNKEIKRVNSNKFKSKDIIEENILEEDKKEIGTDKIKKDEKRKKEIGSKVEVDEKEKERKKKRRRSKKGKIFRR